MTENTSVKIVKTSGWWKDKFYNRPLAALYVIGRQGRETEKATQIGRVWVPKACIAEVREISVEEFVRHYREAEDEFDMIARLGLEGCEAFVKHAEKTYVAYA